MKFIRVINLVLVASCLLPLSVGISAEDGERPDFSLLDYNTRERKSFQDVMASKANILVVTETTCVSCIKELRALDALRKEYQDDVSVTVVFLDRQGEARVGRYLDYYRFDLDMLLVDPGNEVPVKFKVDNIPTMMIFDSRGNEAFRRKGFKDGDESLIASQVQAVIAGKAVGAEASGFPVETSAASPKTKGCFATLGL